MPYILQTMVDLLRKYHAVRVTHEVVERDGEVRIETTYASTKNVPKGIRYSITCSRRLSK